MSLYPVTVKLSTKLNCLTKSTDDNQPETLTTDGRDELDKVEADSRRIVASPNSSDYPSLGIREPVYEVLLFIFYRVRVCVLWFIVWQVIVVIFDCACVCELLIGK